MLRMILCAKSLIVLKDGNLYSIITRNRCVLGSVAQLSRDTLCTQITFHPKSVSCPSVHVIMKENFVVSGLGLFEISVGISKPIRLIREALTRSRVRVWEHHLCRPTIPKLCWATYM